MGSRRKTKKTKLLRWTSDELKTLRSLAKSHPVKAIAKAIRRTEASIRFKAWEKRISLRSARERRA